MTKSIPVLALTALLGLLYLVQPIGVQASPFPSPSPLPVTVFACPAADGGGFPLGPIPPSDNVTANVLFCSYPAFLGENPTDFYCDYNATTGVLVTDHDAGFCPADAVATVAPTFSKAFGATQIFSTQTTSLTFTIANSNVVALTGLTFSDALPAGLVVAITPGVTDTCGGTVTAVAGSGSISLSGGSVAAGGTCTIAVTVAGLGSGVQNNVTSSLTATQAPPADPAAASIIVFLTLDGSFQVSYAADPSAGESYINIINDGAQGAPLQGPGFGTQTGNICVQVYAFAPDEQEISCCTCTITPNSVANLGVNRDLTSNTLTNVIPTSVVVKLVAINPTSTPSGSCTAAQEGTPVSGMVAYGTTPQPLGTVFNVVEHSFIPSTLSTGPTTGNNEYASITGRCAAILGNGSSFGVCNSCKSGALGADKQ